MSRQDPLSAILAGNAPGAVLYRGPSALNGAPIVCVATGFSGARNEKTGADMVQVYILADTGAAVSPAAAARSGADSAACGACPLRGSFDPITGGREAGTRACYVNLGQGPHQVHRAMHAGRYVDLTTAHRATVSRLFAGRGVRLGSYGDAAALPAGLVRAIMRRAAYGTGYTHSPEAAPHLAMYAMASAHTPAHAETLQRAGWRTFRVAPAGDTARMRGEILCPASKEAGHKLQCQDCRACDGHRTGRKAHVMIPAHAGARTIIRRGLVVGA